MGKGIGGHTQPNQGASSDWLTPPHIIESLGPFDLDPCASHNQPWQTANTQYSPPQNGLVLPWKGFIWCNPPYGRETWEWLDQMAEHRNGLALIFARTETIGFFREIWDKADSLLFLEGRLFFHYPETGERAPSNSGGPSVLIGYGSRATGRLRKSDLPGVFITEWF